MVLNDKHCAQLTQRIIAVQGFVSVMGSVRYASAGFLLTAAMWGLLSPCDSGVILRASGRRGGLFAWLKHIPPCMHSQSTRAFVWEWETISRLIHEDLGLRFPVAIKGVFPFL